MLTPNSRSSRCSGSASRTACSWPASFRRSWACSCPGGQELKFTAPVKIGDTVTVTATVSEKRDDKRIIKLQTTVVNQKGEKVVDGNAVIKKLGL